MLPLAAFVRRHFLWVLLSVYGVAAVVPGPGAAAARFDLGAWAGLNARITAPLILVAALLYLAAMAVDASQLRVLLQKPLLWLTGLACVWLGPAAVVAVGAWLLPSLASEAAAGLLLGMTLVAAMPVANSSVAWTQQAGGSLPWSLGLVVLSISLTPWVTPTLLKFSGGALAGADPVLIEQATRSFSGAPFIVWVILPTIAGLATRRAMGPEAADEMAPARKLLSTAILLVLNYGAGSLALGDRPSMVALAAAAIAATALALIGVLLANVLTWALRLDRPTRDALRFSLGMKHTGLAFAVAATAGLTGQRAAMLLIVVATPIQHAVAAAMDWAGQKAEARRQQGEGSDAA
ncbi:MAG: bile acid:sodium symporter [Planctomycetota bacterium]